MSETEKARGTVETRPSPEAPTAFEALGVTHRFGEYVVLEDVSFRVPRGELLCVVGPNGALLPHFVVAINTRVHDPQVVARSVTYIHDLITLCGGRNVFPTGPDPRRPDRRYPIVTLEAVERADPELILLPDEPWAFGEADVRELAGLDCAAARTGRIHPIDGRMVSWYGPRIAEAIQALARLFATR